MEGSAVQLRNDDLVNLLRPEFQDRNEPNFAWKSACSQYLALNGLVAFWPTSALRRDSATDRVRDIASGGYHLNANSVIGTTQFGLDNLIPYGNFVGTSSQSWARLDGGVANWADISGTESYIINKGLTLGTWVKFGNAPGVSEFIIGKWDAVSGNQRAYRIIRNADGTIRFIVSVDGTAATVIDSTAVTAAGIWYFVAGRFDPSTTLDIFVQSDKDTLAAGVPASIFDSTAAVTAGSYHTGGQYLTGRLSLAFLTAANQPDVILFSLFQQTRAMFGV